MSEREVYCHDGCFWINDDKHIDVLGNTGERGKKGEKRTKIPTRKLTETNRISIPTVYVFNKPHRL